MSSEVDTSNLMYLPYYMPDVSFNKVKYSNNLLKNGSILITDPVDGIIDINQKFLGQFKNDYIYQPNIQSTTWNIKFTPYNNNNFTYFNGFLNNITQSTKVNQNSIQNFNYNTIFGLTQADPSVIDWNYYKSDGNSLTDAEYSRLGPKLFYYNNANYITGDFTLPPNLGTVSDPNDILLNSDILSTMNGMTIYPANPLLAPLGISNTTTIAAINNAWPYKVQQKDTQYYNILTNGTTEALLALPKVELNTPTQYLLTTRFNDQSLKNEYSYTDLGDIIQNNYHYIVSYFDTRPTRSNNNTIVFNSLISSVFNENLVQFMPLANFTSSVCKNIHTISDSSNYASCLPIAWTTTQPHTFPYTTEQQLGLLCPIRLEWGKNITITTEINYTCANMINLSNILSGWNYYDSEWKLKNTLPSGASRANVPYINAGLVLYVPNSNYNGYDVLYEGKTYIDANNTDKNLPKSRIFVNLNNGIPTNYYVNIAGSNINLDIPLDPSQKYLPRITEQTSGQWQIVKEQTADVNGIFYNITFVNDRNVSTEYSNKNIDIFETDSVNDFFTAYITLSQSVSKSISYVNDSGNYTFSITIGNTTITKTSDSITGDGITFDNDDAVVIGIYKYKVEISGLTQNSGKCTANITCKATETNPANGAVNVTVFRPNINNASQYYTATEGADAYLPIINNVEYIQYCTQSSDKLYYVTTFNNTTVIFKLNEDKKMPLTRYNNTEYYYTLTITSNPSKSEDNLNFFAKFKNWLNAFEIGPFWGGDAGIPNGALSYLEKIYTYSNTPTNDIKSYQYNFSTPCCLPFDTIASSDNIKNYNNHFITSNSADNTNVGDAFVIDANNFLGYSDRGDIYTDRDLVKLVNVFSVPITNALNTTHTATDTMTFRFEKPTLTGVTDYYYIIGIYLYITKGLPLETLQAYPHYIGFAPSTNILNPSTLQGSGSGGGVPTLLDGSLIKNTTDLYNNDYEDSILMKDYLTTPSIFMSINESTGNNL